MWISRKDFDRLKDRVDALEKNEVSRKIVLPSPTRYVPAHWYAPETISTESAVDALIEYLGVELRKSHPAPASVTAIKKA